MDDRINQWCFLPDQTASTEGMLLQRPPDAYYCALRESNVSDWVESISTDSTLVPGTRIVQSMAFPALWIPRERRHQFQTTTYLRRIQCKTR